MALSVLALAATLPAASTALADDALPAFIAPMTPPVVSAKMEPVNTPPRQRQGQRIIWTDGNCVRRDDNGRFTGWMDYEHCIYSGRTLSTAHWFDDLFGDWYDNEARLMVRAITELSLREGEGVGTNFRLSASAALPNAQKRLRLVITDESDTVNTTGSGGVVPGQAGDLSTTTQPGTASQASAALRWIPVQKAGVKTDFDIGVRGLNPPDLFARFRARKSWSLTRDSLARFGQTFRYGSARQGTSISQLDLERALDENSVARLSSAYEYDQTDHENGFKWEHGVSLSHVLGDTRSLGYGFAVDGHTNPNWRSQSYGPWLLFRSSFRRPWLFYEIEPRVVWDRARNWGSQASIVFRLEVQFGKR